MFRLWLVALIFGSCLLYGCRNLTPSAGPFIHGASASLLPGLYTLALSNSKGEHVVLASTDLQDLRAIIAGDAEPRAFDWQACQAALQPVDRQECLIDPAAPPASLFIAGDFVFPCVNTDLTVDVQAATLRISGHYTPIDCGGAGSLPQSTFSIIAVPVTKLPHQVVRVVFDDGTTSVETMVDLRLPALAVPSPDERYREVAAAVKAARRASTNGGLSGAPDELAIVRWPVDGSGCQALDSSDVHDGAGYVIHLRVDGQTREYRWRNGDLVDCGVK
jgi:hypothetical protein